MKKVSKEHTKFNRHQHTELSQTTSVVKEEKSKKNIIWEEGAGVVYSLHMTFGHQFIWHKLRLHFCAGVQSGCGENYKQGRQVRVDVGRQ
jgi:hypothetical protein